MTVKPALYNDLVIYQGATFDEPLAFTNAATGAIIDLTGYTARMKIKETYDSATSLIELTTENGGIEIDGGLGVVTLKISAADTENLKGGSYVFDLELINGAVVQRYIQGTITVSREVTL